MKLNEICKEIYKLNKKMVSSPAIWWHNRRSSLPEPSNVYAVTNQSAASIKSKNTTNEMANVMVHLALSTMLH